MSQTRIERKLLSVSDFHNINVFMLPVCCSSWEWQQDQ